MKICPISAFAAPLFAIAASPVALAAADGVAVPEAPSSVLFALGVMGVLIGRHVSRRSGRNDKPRD